VNELMVVVALLTGAALGVVFFGGLWWTVHRGVTSAHPARWFMLSLLVRVAVVLGGIYLVTDGQWQRLLACMLGFWLARVVVVRLTREVGPDRAEREVTDAP
jgi:F1F0 ATPase subunit 2